MTTIRVLSIDGGGERGLIPATFLNLFLNQWGIPKNEIWKNFDVIAGTSIGGILALFFSIGLSPDQAIPFFTEIGPWIFTVRTALDVSTGSINASTPSNRPDSAQKLAMMATGDPFYKSIDALSNYGSSRMYSEMNAVFLEKTLQDVKTNVLIPIYDNTLSTFRIFSNCSFPGYYGQNEKIKDVAAGTSAAPIFLPSYILPSTGNVMWDGGIFQNNPASLALTLARQLKPTATKACVLSIGTGLGDYGFDSLASNYVQSTISNDNQNSNTNNQLMVRSGNSFGDLFSLINKSMTGCQESVAQELLFRSSNYNIDKLYNYRFQYYLDKDHYDTNLDNTDTIYLQYLQDSCAANYNNDIDNISTFLGHLTA